MQTQEMIRIPDYRFIAHTGKGIGKVLYTSVANPVVTAKIFREAEGYREQGVECLFGAKVYLKKP